MIDWESTKKEFGFTDQTSLHNIKRPKVICRCDVCHKSRAITIRVKSKIIDGQMKWKCHTCVGLGRSTEISNQMKVCWQNEQYKNNQLEIKQQQQYKSLQSLKSMQRWEISEYRSQLETGINVKNYIVQATHKFGDQFQYDEKSFSNWKSKIIITCNNCQQEFQKLPQHHLYSGTCPFCKLPADLKDLIPKNEKIVVCDRTAIAPLELDIFLPDKKLAIEYHGLYWHSYNSKETSQERNRHQIKSLRCINSNIKLFQIFDFEWANKKSLITSMINNAIGKSTTVNARKLTVDKITNSESESFLNQNHLQGFRPAKVTMALHDNNIIYMIMSFSKYKDGYEIIRMATLKGYRTIGGASRLLHHFKKQFKGPIYTFADLRYSNANVYKKLGFTQLKITKPNYFYYNNKFILSRQQCQKHKLSKLLQEFDNALSEPENMFMNGYRRFWDAGHIKLLYNN